jgi:hypothetical protein
MSSSNPSAMPTYLFPWRIRTRLLKEIPLSLDEWRRRP